MNTIFKLHLEKAENELILAKIILDISQNTSIQKELFRLEKDHTFYSAVITHSYYCIFNCAKAILIYNDVKTDLPSVHQRTLQAFDKFLMQTGKLDKELLRIYEDVAYKADFLLDIFFLEKEKRGRFTYQELPEANLQPAKESIKNAEIFFKSINNILKDNSKLTKLDLRVGKILEVNEHPNADKLFVFKVDLGEEKERTIVAGLRGYYKKEELEGKKAIFVSNLEPAKLRGIESNGMILAAVSDDRKEIAFLKCKTDVKEGTKLEFMES